MKRCHHIKPGQGSIVIDPQEFAQMAFRSARQTQQSDPSAQPPP